MKECCNSTSVAIFLKFNLILLKDRNDHYHLYSKLPGLYDCFFLSAHLNRSVNCSALVPSLVATTTYNIDGVRVGRFNLAELTFERENVQNGHWHACLHRHFIGSINGSF